MAIMASGLLVVLISGGIDISFAAIVAVSQYLVATLLVHYGGNWLVAFGLVVLVWRPARGREHEHGEIK